MSFTQCRWRTGLLFTLSFSHDVVCSILLSRTFFGTRFLHEACLQIDVKAFKEKERRLSTACIRMSGASVRSKYTATRILNEIPYMLTISQYVLLII